MGGLLQSGGTAHGAGSGGKRETPPERRLQGSGGPRGTAAVSAARGAGPLNRSGDVTGRGARRRGAGGRGAGWGGARMRRAERRGAAAAERRPNGGAQREPWLEMARGAGGRPPRLRSLA